MGKYSVRDGVFVLQRDDYTELFDSFRGKKMIVKEVKIDEFFKLVHLNSFDGIDESVCQIFNTLVNKKYLDDSSNIIFNIEYERIFFE